MAPDDKNLPPLRTLQSALYRITESLARELALPSNSAPDWNALEWRLAPAVAAMHGVSSLLAGSLRWRGPLAWNEFLAEQRRHTELRQLRCQELLAKIDERARDAAFAVVPLKGAALHAAQVYAAGERPMADIDLLVHGADLDRAIAVLLSLGYRDAGITWSNRNFDPPSANWRAALGEHAENPLKIDLHTRIAERLPLPETDITDLVYPRAAAPGVNPYPSLASLMVHLLTHTAGSMAHRGLRLVQLCDIARLATRMTGADWDALLGFDMPHHRLWWSFAPLTVVKRYFPESLQVEIIIRLQRGCPRLLRRVSRLKTLSEFSYSHPFVDPLAGFAWVRSPRQLLQYLAARALPSKEHLAEMKAVSKTEPWASEPQWYLQSHISRVIKCLKCRPTRIETMQPIRAALGK